MSYPYDFIKSILIEDGVFIHIIDDYNALVLHSENDMISMAHHTYDDVNNVITRIPCSIPYITLEDMIDKFNDIIANPCNSKDIKLV